MRDAWYGASLSCGIFFSVVSIFKNWVQNESALVYDYKIVTMSHVSLIIYTNLKSIFLHHMIEINIMK